MQIIYVVQTLVFRSDTEEIRIIVTFYPSPNLHFSIYFSINRSTNTTSK